MALNFLNFQDPENIAIPLPITIGTREIAHNFAAQQTTKQKAEQVLYNTLAVLTVKSYLEMLGVPTDLTSSDSWNPVMRACDDVADLNVSNLGKLECRPLKNPDARCHIPMEVWDLRLGYVVVEINESLKKAALLGFVSQVASEELGITDVEPIEGLIDCLHVVKLGEWFDNIFTTGWETVESFLNPDQLVLEWRLRNRGAINGTRNNVELFPENFSESEETNNVNDSVQRAKLIDLGIQLGNCQVVLLVEITPEARGRIGVVLQVHPNSNQAYLPETLTLKVIESSGEVFMQAQARSQDNFIQLQFSGQPKERFTVQIILDDAELQEKFQL